MQLRVEASKLFNSVNQMQEKLQCCSKHKSFGINFDSPEDQAVHLTNFHYEISLRESPADNGKENSGTAAEEQA